MRKNHSIQLTLLAPVVDHPHARELEVISGLLDANPVIAELAAQDLAGERSRSLGRPGLSGDQVIRVAVLRQIRGWSYEELEFQLVDSASARRFVRLGLGDQAPCRSTLQDNIRRLRPETLETIHRILVGDGVERGIERGEKVRVDCTVTETNIHPPDDAAQLWDVVRVLTRLLTRAQESGYAVDFARRTLRAKRRRMGVMHAKKAKKRRGAYRDLIKVCEEVVGFAEANAEALPDEPGAQAIAAKLRRAAELGRRVIDQTRRRVFEGERVPASEKVVSLFEPHTDIIVKGRRDVLYGHKLCLTAGGSSLVIDYVVHEGNPADSTMVGDMLDRATEVLGRVPRQAAFDGGFASRANLAAAKTRGVRDVCFSKGRGLDVADMVRSDGVFKRLRRFRAGVEGVISFLKRVVGLRRCPWRGRQGFKRYVGLAVIAANLLTIARAMPN